MLVFENRQLLMKGRIFNDEVLARQAQGTHDAEDELEHHSYHDEKIPIYGDSIQYGRGCDRTETSISGSDLVLSNDNDIG